MITVEEGRAILSRKRKRNKYRNKRCEFRGEKFDSIKEMNRYIALLEDENSGKIMRLERQHKYLFELNGVLMGSYCCDFLYRKWDGKKWIEVVEDVKANYLFSKAKGKRTSTPAYDMFLFKKRMMKAFHNIEVLVV